MLEGDGARITSYTRKGSTVCKALSPPQKTTNIWVVELVPPAAKGGKWQVSYGWSTKMPGRASTAVEYKTLKNNAKIALKIPFDSETKPGIAGTLRFVISAWNA